VLNEVAQQLRLAHTTNHQVAQPPHQATPDIVRNQDSAKAEREQRRTDADARITEAAEKIALRLLATKGAVVTPGVGKAIASYTTQSPTRDWPYINKLEVIYAANEKGEPVFDSAQPSVESISFTAYTPTLENGRTINERAGGTLYDNSAGDWTITDDRGERDKYISLKTTAGPSRIAVDYEISRLNDYAAQTLDQRLSN
jgi:hypothetical protein